MQGGGGGGREVVMDGAPAFPHRIVLGPVWQDLRPVSGTEATVTAQFEVLRESR
ncbi:MAG: hypothetical protein ACE5F6_09910 [Anaerolineae bacterium]